MTTIATSQKLNCEQVSKSYGDIQAVKNLSLRISAGEIVSLLGPSGCGKTTLLRLIAGFEEPDGGTVRIDDNLIASASQNTAIEKRNVGMVFQDGALFPHLTVEQNVKYGLSKTDTAKLRVKEVLQLVGLTDLTRRMPHQLSGGQQQRIALARALAPNPNILLLDEPFSNLDPGLRGQIRQDTLNILKANSVTALFVTHDQEEALLMGDRIAVMHEGGIEQCDSPENIFHHPSTKFVAQFIGTADFIKAEWNGAQVTSPLGRVAVAHQTDAKRNTALEVMVRPDCVECFPSNTNPNGIIVGKDFRGASYLYHVRLSTNELIRCQLSHTEDFAIGTDVQVNVRNHHSLTPFAQGISLDS